jgi:hypothetical protein
MTLRLAGRRFGRATAALSGAAYVDRMPPFAWNAATVVRFRSIRRAWLPDHQIVACSKCGVSLGTWRDLKKNGEGPASGGALPPATHRGGFRWTACVLSVDLGRAVGKMRFRPNKLLQRRSRFIIAATLLAYGRAEVTVGYRTLRATGQRRGTAFPSISCADVNVRSQVPR